MQQAEEYRARTAEMRAMASRVHRDLAAQYLKLADAYDELATQRIELLAVREKLNRTEG